MQSIRFQRAHLETIPIKPKAGPSRAETRLIRPDSDQGRALRPARMLVEPTSSGILFDSSTATFAAEFFPKPAKSGSHETGRMNQAKASQAKAERRRGSREAVELPGQNLTLAETLRVMDVAREMRDQRQRAEEMFRRDEIRVALREKLVRTARMSGDDVTEAEIDAAIDQYLETLYTYSDPEPGFQRFLAHVWVWRQRILWSAAGLAAAAGGLWYFFG